MKKILTILAIMFSVACLGQTKKPCPIVGESNKKTDQFNDSLKNRNLINTNIEYVDIHRLLEKGDDTNRFKYSSYVKVYGIITEVKHGGSELCNCHSNEKADLDIHIVLSDSTGNGKIICEINRFTQASNKSLSYANVHSMIGKKVIIYGWLFFDGEHKQNATNTCTVNTNVWRTTCWEIHPVMDIEVIK